MTDDKRIATIRAELAHPEWGKRRWVPVAWARDALAALLREKNNGPS